MRKLAIIIAAVLATGALAPAAWAQDDDAPAKGGKPGKIEARGKVADLAKTRADALKETPALLQQAGVSCTVTDAAMKGVSKTEVGGKKVNTKVYEVACSDAPGYMILAPDGGGTASAYDCLALTTAKDAVTKCDLPANADPIKSFQPLVTKAAVQCPIAKARYMGSNLQDKVDLYEIGCADGTAYVLTNPRAGATRQLGAQNCALVSLSGAGSCTYVTKADAVKTIATIGAPAKRTACQVSDARYMGVSTETHDIFYEVGCTDGKSGYVLELTPANAYKAAIDCTRASGIGGGCQLSTVDMAETSDSATYTKASSDAGYPCQVSKYHSIGLDPASRREIVELACTGKPGSVIAFLPVDKGQKLDVWNCARAEARGLKCALAPMAPTYAIMSQQATANRQECQVNATRAVGSTPEGNDYVEVGCTNGGALMYEYGPGVDKLITVIGCAQAHSIGGGCKLAKKS